MGDPWAQKQKLGSPIFHPDTPIPIKASVFTQGMGKKRVPTLQQIWFNQYRCSNALPGARPHSNSKNDDNTGISFSASNLPPRFALLSHLFLPI